MIKLGFIYLNAVVWNVPYLYYTIEKESQLLINWLPDYLILSNSITVITEILISTLTYILNNKNNVMIEL